ncbi:MAG TPA: DUF484 family protein [Nitrosomonas sp.]|nr:DUF484 family protein [Nitrosomonas sp.]HMY61436.1 DUF484 family protein [Nitrosomonas sp.]
MKPEDVAQYLQENPQFFETYADMLAEIKIPQPYDGRAISISERQISTLREKNKLLQEKLHELINIGENNDTIGEKMHRLAVSLLEFNSVEELLHGLNYNLCEDFSIPHVVMRLWYLNDIKSNQKRPEFSTVSKTVRISVESMRKPYCGPQVSDDIKPWFGQDAKYLQSFSIIPLRRKRTIGLLVMGSPDAERFYPDMGTLYLERLGELVSSALARLERIDLEQIIDEPPKI